MKLTMLEETHSTEQGQQDISECFQYVGISQLKVYAQPLSGRVNLTLLFLPFKRKLLDRVLNVTPEEINLDTSTTEDVDLWIKAENFDRLMQLIKEKLSTIKTNREIIQVLTLAPETWSIKKVANFFNVTEYAARKARSHVQEKGSWVYRTKKGKKLISKYS